MSEPLSKQHRGRRRTNQWQGQKKNLFDLVRLKSPSDQIVEQVRGLIANGHLKLGQRLPTEREMAVMLGVGRQAVRGALSKLARLGLVEVVPFKGAFIRSLTPESLREPLLTLLNSEISNMFEFMKVREVLESWCAGEAARRADVAKLKRIEDSLAMMEDAIREGRSISKADIEFHTAIAEAAENVILVHLMDTFTTLLYSTERFRNVAAHARNVVTYLGEHKAIYEAIKSRDPSEARGRMRSHIRTVTSRVEDVLKSLELDTVGGKDTPSRGRAGKPSGASRGLGSSDRVAGRLVPPILTVKG